jgi:rhodanese-related sulfurtransferase
MNDKTIVDVRSYGEFQGGHIAGSVNIPLNEIPSRIEEFKSKQNLVLCCASGNRSGQAVSFLKANGIDCENGGGWMELNYKLQEAS